LEDLYEDDEEEGYSESYTHKGGDTSCASGSGKVSAGGSSHSVDSSADDSSDSRGGLFAQFSRRTVFRKQRFAQKKEDGRYRSDDDIAEDTEENHLEDVDDPEFTEAKAMVRGRSVNDDDGVINSSSGSLKLVQTTPFPNQQGSSHPGNADSDPKSFNGGLGALLSPPDPRKMFSQHVKSLQFPRRNFGKSSSIVDSDED